MPRYARSSDEIAEINSPVTGRLLRCAEQLVVVERLPLWSDAWGDQVIGDLGITIWRNEHYPPSDNLDTQDTDWNKQRPVVQGLKRKADQYAVNLKFIFTVW